MRSFDFTGTTAVVTGAGSGIGRNIALGLAKRGVKGLALCDIREDLVQETASLLEASGVHVSVHVFDIAERSAIEALPAQVLTAHDSVEVLVNNAGVTLGGTFDACTIDEFEWVLTINLLGVTRMTRVFLPQLKQVSSAQIINISSLFGLISVPGQAAYCASKFGVRGFSDALRHELAGSDISVTTVHPGGVNTNIAKSARMSESATEEEIEAGLRQAEQNLVMPPSKASDIILRGVERRRPRVLVGKDAHILHWLERLMPSSYWGLMARRLGRAKTEG